MTGPRRVRILLVDNDSGDQGLVRRLFAGGGYQPELEFAETGDEALEMLHGGEEDGAPDDGRRPDLILIDLNLPGMSGLALLERLRADRACRAIPIVVLTTSRDEADVARSYELGASSFLTKPGELEEFKAMIKALGEYWLRAVTLPPRPKKP